jgi:hypothetical protein
MFYNCHFITGYLNKGLSMKMLKEEAQDKTSEFAFEHNTDYQKIQFLFLDAIDSLDHNNIIVIACCLLKY